jgi:hypothetical protein
MLMLAKANNAQCRGAAISLGRERGGGDKDHGGDGES